MNEASVARWRHAGRCIEGALFEIEGVNVWAYEWHRIPDIWAAGREPLYGEEYRFPVYEIRLAARTIRFGAGEHSANVYGFALPDAAS
jgi:hypothetical protein